MQKKTLKKLKHGEIVKPAFKYIIDKCRGYRMTWFRTIMFVFFMLCCSYIVDVFL